MEDELEGMDEGAEELIEQTEALTKEGSAEDNAINEAIKESIKEFNEDAVKEAVSNALEEEGIEPTDELVEKGREILAEEGRQTDRGSTIEEEPAQPPKEITGSEGTPKSYYDRPEKSAKQEVPWPGGKNTAKITKRERLEAIKEGLDTYLEEDAKRISKDPDVIEHRQHIKERTLEKLQEIEEELNSLPPHPPKQERPKIEDVTEKIAKQCGYEDAEQMRDSLEYQEWAEGLDNFRKESKLRFIKDIYSRGIEKDGKFGFEALGEANKELDQIIKEATELRKKRTNYFRY